MISISQNAEEHFVKLLDKQADKTRIRVFVVNPGTRSAECGVSYCPEESVETDDIILPFNGFEAVVDAESKPYLEEAEIDFCEAGETLKGQPVDGHSDVLHVDTGKGKLDHHQFDKYLSAAQLCFDYVKKQRKGQIVPVTWRDCRRRQQNFWKHLLALPVICLDYTF